MPDNEMNFFIIQELVPPEVYSIFGVNSIWFIDQELVRDLEKLRTDIGKPIYVNNWHWGGQQKNRGFRMPDATVGGKLSQHKFGRAIDFAVKDMTPAQVRRYLIDTFGRYCFTTIEKDTPTWTHVDKRWTGLDYMLEVPYR